MASAIPAASQIFDPGKLPDWPRDYCDFSAKLGLLCNGWQKPIKPVE